MPVTVCPDNLASLRAELAPLYCRYPHQTEPQPAYVQLDEDGDVTTGYSGEIGGGVPAHVWHGRTLRWTVPASVQGDVLADLLAGDALPLLQRLLRQPRKPHPLRLRLLKLLTLSTSEAFQAT